MRIIEKLVRIDKLMVSEKAVSKIGQLREKAKLSQVQLAAFTDVTVNTIQNWEKGKGLDNIERLLKLCAALECDVFELIEYVPSEEVENSKEPKKFTLEDIRSIRQRWTSRHNGKTKKNRQGENTL